MEYPSSPIRLTDRNFLMSASRRASQSGRWLLLFAVLLALSGLAGRSPAFAAAPANDNFANATTISGFPFTDTVDITDAGTEPGEPTCFCFCMSKTVWYTVSVATDTALTVSVQGATNGGTVNIYQDNGSGLCCLNYVTCAAFQKALFTAKAGLTYRIQAGPTFDSSGNLTVHVDVVPPPANDNFASATPVTAIPFSAQVDLTGATTEPGEPAPSCAPLQGTAWYAFTPGASGSYTLNLPGCFCSALNVYTGSSLTSLTELACNLNGPVVFHADVGTMYYLRVGGGYGPPPSGPITVSLDVAPPPVTSFSFYPPDPSTVDTIQFNVYKYDPAGGQFGPDYWNFGDGAAGTNPTHKYAADGDYTVTLVSTTLDGRSATVTQVVHVRTHDVSITKFTVPQSASSGQTRAISVGVTTTRYPETVQVDLSKSTPFGFQPVGSLILSVPIRSGNRTTSFDFSYTLTADDAAVGSVTFLAVATIQLARDAFPADNQATALPTKVNK